MLHLPLLVQYLKWLGGCITVWVCEWVIALVGSLLDSFKMSSQRPGWILREYDFAGLNIRNYDLGILAVCTILPGTCCPLISTHTDWSSKGDLSYYIINMPHLLPDRNVKGGYPCHTSFSFEEVVGTLMGSEAEYFLELFILLLQELEDFLPWLISSMFPIVIQYLLANQLLGLIQL